jgi:hypothetical protein
MDKEREARRAVLAPQMRGFKELDAEGKLAGMDKMFKTMSMEVSQLSCTSANYLRQLQLFKEHVDAAKDTVVKLETALKREMLAQVAALKKGWDRVEAATSCWVEVYDKDPSDKTAVRLRCGYITEADDMLERLCTLLPLEEWDEVYCCSPGAFWMPRKLFLSSDRWHANLQDKLEAKKKLVFHNDSEGFDKQQLVIVRRSLSGRRLSTTAQ